MCILTALTKRVSFGLSVMFLCLPDAVGTLSKGDGIFKYRAASHTLNTMDLPFVKVLIANTSLSLIRESFEPQSFELYGIIVIIFWEGHVANFCNYCI